MTTLEEQLEAAIWSAMRLCKVTCPAPGLFVDAVKQAAVVYGAGDSEELTAMRRAVLSRDAWPEGQTSPSDCGGDGGTAYEPNAPRSTAAGPASTAVGGATLSTGPDVPARGQSSGKSYPQAVDNRGGRA